MEGWEPAEHTKIIKRDAEGRPAEMITTRDPEWSLEDRVMVDAVLAYEADLCPGCGQPLSESLHVQGNEEKKYRAGYSVCMGCVARSRAQHKQHVADEPHLKRGAHVAYDARLWAVDPSP